MKYTQIFFLLILFLSSCTYEEKAIFDLSPAERLNDAMSSHKNTLISATNGWEMQYFANPESAGFTLLVKFETSGKAIFAAQNDYTQNKAYEKDSSLFEIIGDNGPVLTFNTYNKILHRFSNPENPDGYGLQGDYEFVILSSDADKVVLEGKKYKSKIILSKLPTTTNWQQHLQAINNTYNLMFSAKSPKLTLNINNANYSFANGYSHVFNFKKEGTATTQPIPFIVTKNGIRLYKELEIEGKKFQNFELASDGSALVSVENATDKLIGVDDLASYFVTNTKEWKLDSEKMSTDLKNTYLSVFNSFATVYDAESINMSVLYALNRVSFVLKISYTTGNTQVDGLLDIAFNTTSKDGLAIVKKNTGDTNGQKFKNEIASLNDFLTQIASEYTLKTATKLNPLQIDFVKKTNANSWFTLSDK
jgi:hypothetical protein